MWLNWYIFKQLKRNITTMFLNVVREYEWLVEKFMKSAADIKLIKICKKEYLVPIFVNFKLANKSVYMKLKLKLPQIIMEAEFKQKDQKKSKMKEEILSIDISLRTLLHVTFYNCIIYQIKIAMKSKLKEVLKRHVKKLVKKVFKKKYCLEMTRKSHQTYCSQLL